MRQSLDEDSNRTQMVSPFEHVGGTLDVLGEAFRLLQFFFFFLKGFERQANRATRQKNNNWSENYVAYPLCGCLKKILIMPLDIYSEGERNASDVEREKKGKKKEMRVMARA